MTPSASGSFSRTAKQEQLWDLIAGPAKHILAFGGSRSAKTFGILEALALRAIIAPGSRHAVFRFRLSHVKSSVIADTWPKMLKLCHPDEPVEFDKQELVARFPAREGSEVWFGGLDDKDRTEKILGQEHSTIFLNECSQIPFASRTLAVTRLAQKVSVPEFGRQLRLKMFYDCNPPNKAHWLYQLFVKKQIPETGDALKDPENYAWLQMNPQDNAANLPSDYISELENLPSRMKVRFLRGEFGDAAEGALWTIEQIERYRDTEVPDLQRIVIGIDPSGAADKDNAGNDEIGVIVGGLGVDGNAYVLEDLSLKAGPEKWGGVAVGAYDRHDADVVVGETNFGGDMVRFVVHAAASKPERAAKPRPTFKKITASRGKVVRAEPISVLTEQGKIRFAGRFPKLEDELCGFTTTGYTGSGSPNRADAFVWVMAELFPGLVKRREEETKPEQPRRGLMETASQGANNGWMR